MQKNTCSLAKSAKVFLGLAGCAAVTLISYATVTFDLTSGGWAGKGDVQTALGGINNAAIQKLVTDGKVMFRYVSSETSSWTCDHWFMDSSWVGTGKDKERVWDDPYIKGSQTKTSIQGISATIDSDPRQVKGQKQWTGFFLAVVGSPVVTTSGSENVGDCPAGQTSEAQQTWWELSPDGVTTTATGAGLEVSGDGGQTWVPLPITPVSTTTI